MTELIVGKKAPSFTAKNANDESVKLADLVGKNGVVIYFYPRDMTPGCTTEACDFRDNFARIKKLGFNVVGISKDTTKSHTKFIEKESLNFDLISDETGEICEKYGVWREKVFMGRKGMGIVRTTFILDSSLKIKKIYDSVRVKGHVEEIIKDIQEL
ncbi:thioredoxin-dependent thiol peroxidase [Leptospira ilyithenensis]|uniref:thioredoxin-dependent peroxiredoxin n=1 Tax=Leptospira ilyithenensis TaxID=2484901 RepID=A0A4R9LMT0_9LEPT|nr:thioredoxin-dependent thiol peroxidase [Leptospira ilyithenensis]TGN09798.1 thioredoxin-dependent thiol peroxidase [Leptospira ilyithenensis]